MHRRALLKSLNQYLLRYPDECQQCAEIIAFVEQHEDCFERSQLSGHITGSCWLLDGTGENVLLTQHRKLGKWLQPGGHADGESHVLTVALREACEESGIEEISAVSTQIFDLDIHRIPVYGDVPEHLHYDCRYLLRAPDNARLVISDESTDLRWVGLARIREYTHEGSILRMAEKGAAYPVDRGY